MNKLTKTLALTVLSIASISAVQATEVVAADGYVTSELCAVAAQGNKFKMHSAIKNAHLDKKFVVENVKCNNSDILAFVAKHGENSDAMIDMLLPSSRQNKVTITDIASVSAN